MSKTRDLADSVNPLQIPGERIADGALTSDKISSSGISSDKLSFSNGAVPPAVERLVSSKLSDLISVKDFGAVGNGITNDTDAIQAAVTAAAGVGTQS